MVQYKCSVNRILSVNTTNCFPLAVLSPTSLPSQQHPGKHTEQTSPVMGCLVCLWSHGEVSSTPQNSSDHFASCLHPHLWIGRCVSPYCGQKLESVLLVAELFCLLGLNLQQLSNILRNKSSIRAWTFSRSNILWYSPVSFLAWTVTVMSAGYLSHGLNTVTLLFAVLSQEGYSEEKLGLIRLVVTI